MISELQTFILTFVISGSAAIISKTITAPVERAKLILQNQTSAYQIITGQREKYTGLIDIFVRVPKEQGTLSLWRGNGVNLLRYFPSQALNFSLYDAFKRNYFKRFKKDTGGKVMLGKLLAGGLAGAISTTIVFPLQLCQTRITVDIGSNAKFKKCKIPREFLGLNHCVTAIIARDGIRGIYRGMGISVAGITLYRSIYFAFFDMMKMMYSKASLDNDNYQKPPLVVLFISAQLVTTSAGFIVYPLDTISRYMMLDSGRPKSMRKCETFKKTVKHIYKTHGVVGFYKGTVSNILRCTAGALVLVLYDEFLYYTNWKERIK